MKVFFSFFHFFSFFLVLLAKILRKIVTLPNIYNKRILKKLDKLILKSYLGPLGLTFSISMFVLLLQFLWAKIVALVGKGLDTWIIMKLLYYACITLVPMALPLSILLASIMTMGNFGERYELVAMKSAGIPLWRILRPLIFMSVLFTLFAFYISNNLMPQANKDLKVLLYEIRTKKPAINIKEKQFYYDINNYVIRVGKKDAKTNKLKDVLIYDHSKDEGNISVTKADSGLMYSTDNGNTLVFELYDGSSFNEDIDGANYYKRPLIRMNFKKQTIRFDVSDFSLQKADKDKYNNDYKFLNVRQLSLYSDSLRKANSDFKSFLLENSYNYFNLNSQEKTNEQTRYDFYTDYNNLDFTNKQDVDNYSNMKIRLYHSDISSSYNNDEANKELINRVDNEYHKKFTLSLACIILFFIGAPLGAIIRKGGLGMPVVVSIISFVIYYVIGVMGEMSARSGAITPFVGIWLSTFIFLPIGIFLTMKATTDSKLLNAEIWERRINILMNKIKSIIKTKK
jgi:lipopolysaccharide export system permease protein